MMDKGDVAKSHGQRCATKPGIGRGKALLVGTLLYALGLTVALAADPPSLIREALDQHPAMRSQRGLSEAAQAGVEGARWQFYPTPSVALEHASASSTDPAYRGDSRVATLRLQQPLWTGGRLTGNLDKAQARESVTLADLEITRQQLALRVIQSWSDASAAQLKFTALEQSRDTHGRLLAQVQRRATEGASAQADVELARSRLDATEADLLAARAQRDSALDKLRILIGRALAQGDIGGRDTMPALGQDLDALLQAARDQSPQLAKARAQARIAEADVVVARAALWPEVYLRAERQYGSFTVANADPENRVLLGLSTAFGGGLSSLSGIEAARAQHRAVLDDIQTQQLAVDEQVMGDWTLHQAAVARRAGLERARQSAADVSASWERQFLAGRKQWQDLMNAARELAQTDAQLADAIGAEQLTGWRLALLSLGVDGVLNGTDRR